MNWLAHLLLSHPTPGFRVGNLLPDLLTRSELRVLPAHFQPGIECHHRIDSFTDSHWAVRQSIVRIEPPFRRFGGILIDLFYDHLLARHWAHYSPLPLEAFARESYGAIERHLHEIPSHAHPRLRAMIAEDWLSAYRELDGLKRAAEGIGRRLRKPVDLRSAVDRMAERQEDLRADFECFFPELAKHVASESDQPKGHAAR